MTHSDIKTKFLIEYDKMTTTSSYPSLTDYEIATVLDKAYLAIIAGKLTGNNARKAMFESDNKAIEDVRPLISKVSLQKALLADQWLHENECTYSIEDVKDWMYFIQAFLNISKSTLLEPTISKPTTKYSEVQLVSHQDAMHFMNTDTNLPWIPKPVIFIENNLIHLLYDSEKYNIKQIGNLICTYIKKPAPFCLKNNQCDFSPTTSFELNDNVAQEVINLAIIMSAEIVESQRLSTKASINSFES